MIGTTGFALDAMQIWLSLKLWSDAQMPAYNFQKRFAQLIRIGEKTTTIRPCRQKRPTRVGDQLILFTDMRTKQCARIGAYRCCRVLPIRIDVVHETVHLAGYELADWEIRELARKDGFSGITEFFTFFRKVYGVALPEMELITWEPQTDEVSRLMNEYLVGS
jgi:hypothetical protein